MGDGGYGGYGGREGEFFRGWLGHVEERSELGTDHGADEEREARPAFLDREKNIAQQSPNSP